MKRKYGFWAAVMLTALIGHGCDQPLSTKLKIKTDNLNYSFNTKIADVDMFSVLRSKLVKGKFDLYAELAKIVEGNKNVRSLDLYDMVKYQNGKVQAFLAAAQMDLLESFNPRDYLERINLQLDSEHISTSITLPKFTIDKMEEKIFWFDMTKLFEDMEGKINFTSMPDFDIVKAPLLLPGQNDVDLSSLQVPPFIAWNNNDDKENFDAVVVHSGYVKFTITSKNGVYPDINTDDLKAANAEIRLSGIKLLGEVSGKDIGKPDSNIAVLNEDNEFSEVISIDLTDAHIDINDKPVFHIDYVKTNSENLVSGFVINVESKLDTISLRGAEGLKIGATTYPLPDNALKAMTLDLPDEFVNAKIEEGSMTIGINLPRKDKPWTPETKTFIDGAEISYKIDIKQDSFLYSGKSFSGLDLFEFYTPEDEYLEVDLEGEHINGNNEINASETMITISMETQNGVSFELWDDETGDAYTKKSLPVLIDMDMKIKKLKLARWKTTNITVPKIPEIDFGEGGLNISRFITSIDFNPITVNIDLTLSDELQDRLAVNLTCPKLGFNGYDDSYIWLNNGNNGLHQLKGNGPVSLNLETDNPLAPLLSLAPIVLPDPHLEPGGNNLPKPNPDAGYIELGPLTLNGDGNTVLEIDGDVSFNFDWEIATINLKKIIEEYGEGELDAITGTFPVSGLDQVAKYMGGFMFSDIDIQIVFGGPQGLLDTLEPALTLRAEYLKLKDGANPNTAGEDDWEPSDHILVPETELKRTEVNAGSLASVLKDYIDGDNYTLDSLPNIKNAIDITDFSEVLENFPKDLIFSYRMTFLEKKDEIEVKKADFEEVKEGDNSAVKALLLVKLPLILKAGPDGAIFTMNELFTEKDENGDPVLKLNDILGRKDAGDGTPEDIFKDINIKKVELRIEFDASILGGAWLHIERDEPERGGEPLFGNSGLHLMPNGDKKLTVAINKKDFDIIRKNFILPDVRLTFKEGSQITIPRNPLPIRISFSAGGDYTIPLEFKL